MWNLLQDELGGGVWPRLLVALVDTGAKGLILMAAAGLAAAALRRNAAAARHLVWMLALCGLLILPVLSLMMPKWTLPILPALEAPAVAPSAATPPIATAPAAPNVVSTPMTEIAPAVPNVIPPTARSERPTAPIGAVPPESARAPMNYGVWLLATWLAFALLSLAPFAAGVVAVARMRRAEAFSEGDLQALASALGRSIGLKRPARLLRGPAGSMPMATGFLRPAVVLPDDAFAWTEEKRRVVLLHELAHVKRRDCLAHAIARVAVSLHWFNPLAWLALRQLRIEREHACDDLVLAAGERPSAYAENLLEIARTLRASTVVSAAAITMAQKSQLEGRLLAVLDAARNRGRVTKRMCLTILATMLAALIIVSPLELTRARELSVPAYAQGKWRADGKKVTINGVSLNLPLSLEFDAGGAIVGHLGDVSISDAQIAAWTTLDSLEHYQDFDHKIEGHLKGLLDGTLYDGPVLIGLIDQDDHWLARPFIMDPSGGSQLMFGLSHYMMESSQTLRFAGGLAATIVAVGEPEGHTTRTVWLPDGTPLEKVPLGYEENFGSFPPDDGEMARRVFIDIGPATSDMDLTITAKLNGLPGGTMDVQAYGKKKFVFHANLQDSPTGVLELGIASGPWTTLMDVGPKGLPKGRNFNAPKSTVTNEDGQAFLNVMHSSIEQDYRLMLVDQEGKETHARRWSTRFVDDNLYESRFVIPTNIELPSIDKALLQVRDFEWKKFEGTALQPAGDDTPNVSNLASFPDARVVIYNGAQGSDSYAQHEFGPHHGKIEKGYPGPIGSLMWTYNGPAEDGWKFSFHRFYTPDFPGRDEATADVVYKGGTLPVMIDEHQWIGIEAGKEIPMLPPDTATLENPASLYTDPIDHFFAGSRARQERLLRQGIKVEFVQHLKNNLDAPNQVEEYLGTLWMLNDNEVVELRDAKGRTARHYQIDGRHVTEGPDFWRGASGNMLLPPNSFDGNGTGRRIGYPINYGIPGSNLALQWKSPHKDDEQRVREPLERGRILPGDMVSSGLANGVPFIAFGIEPVTVAPQTGFAWLASRDVSASSLFEIGDGLWFPRKMVHAPPPQLGFDGTLSRYHEDLTVVDVILAPEFPEGLFNLPEPDDGDLVYVDYASWNEQWKDNAEVSRNWVLNSVNSEATFNWETDMSLEDRGVLEVSEFWRIPGNAEATLDSGQPLPFYDRQADKVVWARYDSNTQRIIRLAEAPASPASSPAADPNSTEDPSNNSTVVPPAYGAFGDFGTLHEDPNLLTRIAGDAITPPAANTSWGPVVNGLQAAVRFKPEKSEYLVGEKIDMEFLIRNTGPEPVDFLTSETRLFQLYLSRKISTSNSVNSDMAKIRRVKLAPGEVASIDGMCNTEMLNSTKQEPEDPIGTYEESHPDVHEVLFNLHFPDVYTSSGEFAPRPGDWTGTLTTGKRNLKIVESKVPIEAAPAQVTEVQSTTESAVRAILAEMQDDEEGYLVTVAASQRERLRALLPDAADHLQGVASDDREEARADRRKAASILSELWTEIPREKLEKFFATAGRTYVRSRPVYPQGIAALIDTGYNFSECVGLWKSGDGLVIRTTTRRTVDGQPDGEPFESTGSGAGAGWIETKSLSPGSHTVQLFTDYEIVHHGLTFTGTLDSEPATFEIGPPSLPDDLAAPASEELEQHVRRALEISSFESMSFDGDSLQGDQPNVIFLGPVGAGTGIHHPVWKLTEALPVDLCFDVTFQLEEGGEEFAAYPLIVLKNTTAEAYFAPRDVRAFAEGRTGAVAVRIILTPSRAQALIDLTITQYYNGPAITSEVVEAFVDPPTEKETVNSNDLTLGHEVEVTVGHSGESSMFDFDTGKLCTPPDFQNATEAFAWTAQNGVDVSGGNQPEVRGLMGWELWFLPMPNSFWDDAAKDPKLVRNVLERLNSVPPDYRRSGMPPEYLSATSGQTVTFAFRTRECRYGVVQILGFEDEEPRAVRVRYRISTGPPSEALRQSVAKHRSLSTPKTTEDFLRTPGDDIVWGETTNGLQAAFHFLSEKTEYTLGQTVPMEFLVRNGSSAPVEFVINSSSNLGEPVGVGASGERLRLDSFYLPGTGWPTPARIVLAPGQIAGIPSDGVVFMPRQEGAVVENTVGNKIKTEPGELGLAFVIALPGMRNQGFGAPRPDDWKGVLTTGTRTINVVEKVAQELTLGPEVEVTVGHSGENCMIDFDTGKLFTPPEFNGTEDVFAWAAKNGIDAGGGNQPEVRGLIGMDLVLNPEANMIWEAAETNGTLKHNAFKYGTPGNPVYLSAKGELPATWTFKTREGGLGIVQILGFEDEEPRGVKIRYRMLEKGSK